MSRTLEVHDPGDISALRLGEVDSTEFSRGSQ